MSARRRGGANGSGPARRQPSAGNGPTPDEEVDDAAVDDAAVDGAADAGDEEAEDVEPTPEEILEKDFEAELEIAAETEGLVDGDAEPKRHNVFVRLYRGETAFDFIGRRKWWFTISSIVVLVSILSLCTRGLNRSIEFKGGESWLVASKTLTVADATAAAKQAGVTDPTVVQLTNQLNHTRQIEVTADLNGKSEQVRTQIERNVTDALAAAGHTEPGSVNLNEVGPSWGSNVTKRAIEALIVFFILVTIYISIRFEFKMAVAAIVAVIHDVLVTAGIFSLTGFQVTPDTVVAVLTVLGYSLYDTVVVFDRIRDNSKGLGASGRITYSDMVNLSMNQTLARSINTSLVAIIPVLSVLVIGSFVLGATSLQDFGLALVIGLASGAYSSIFIASPLLALMKEREPRYITIRQRIESRGERVGVLTPLAAAAMGGAGASSGRGGDRGRAVPSGVIRPGAAKRGAATSSATVAGGASSGTGNGAPLAGAAARGGSGGARGASGGSTRPAGKRPPPRPRKGKGGSKGKGRRR
jgi:preprotein translocase subunit SecF